MAKSKKKAKLKTQLTLQEIHSKFKLYNGMHAAAAGMY